MEAKIKEVFNNMTYGENIEDTSEAQEWLSKVKFKESRDISDILPNINIIDRYVDSGILYKLAQEIETNNAIICQIEILTRGVLSKDTKKAALALADYFYYYSTFPQDLGIETRKGVAVGIFGDDHPLWILGLILAPAISAGKTVILQTGLKFACVVTYLLELAIKVGIPPNAINLVPSKEANLQPYLDNENVKHLVVFDDLLNGKYKGFRTKPIFVSVFSAYNAPMLVFDSADLDSAAESVLDAAWGYQGMLPWSINTVLIQENVFSEFTKKLKATVAKTRIGKGDDKLADISYPSNPKVSEALAKTVAKAKLQGIEVFQKESTGEDDFLLTLIVGARVGTNNVLGGVEKEDARVVTLLPFRGIDEAVNLANNCRQGLGASVWSENVGLINEVARKLEVANVWVNSHGLFSPEITMTPLKESGVGHFGGKEGWNTYNNMAIRSVFPAQFKPSKGPIGLKNAIEAGKAASASWSKTSFINKIKVLRQLLEIKKNNVDENCFSRILRDIVNTSTIRSSATVNSYHVTTLKNLLGTIVIETEQLDLSFEYVIKALLEGNAVIILALDEKTLEFGQDVSKQLPSGLLSVFPFSKEATKVAMGHKEVKRYFSLSQNEFLESLPLAESIRHNMGCTIFDIQSFKNVWSNIGQSSQCNL